MAGITGEEALAASMQYTDESMQGAGAVAGKPCQIQSITDITGGHRVTFLWVDNAGTSHTSTMDVKDGVDGTDGVSITGVAIDTSNNHLMVTLSTGTELDAGEVPTVQGEQGETGPEGKSAYEVAVEEGFPGTEAEWLASLKGADGYSPTIEVESSTSTEYILRITTAEGSYLTPNLKGSGSGSATTLGELDDVQLTNPQTGQIIKFNAVTGKWENADGIEINSLGDINDVNLTNLQDGQIIAWDAANSKWVNKTAANPTQFSTMPAAEGYPTAVIQYIGASGATYKRGYFYRSTPSVDPVSGDVVYNWVQTDTQPSNNNYEDMTNLPSINSIEVIGAKTSADYKLQDQMQFTTLPAADSTLLGKIYQYTGATGAGLVNGFYYQCRYNSDTTEYEWKNVDVSGNAALANRVTQLETNQGNMSQLEIGGVTNLVDALNKLDLRKVKTITYTEPNLLITYYDDTVFTFNVQVILSDTQLGDLGDVVDNTIQNTNVLAYDSAIARYKPYDIVLALQNCLLAAKDYTDQEIASAVVAGAYVCDEKPSYDAVNDTVIYKQNGVIKTTTNTDARFYYNDAEDHPMCTSWIDDIEFTFSVASVDFEDYVNKNTDVTSVYTEDALDKTKIPNIAALDTLMAIVNLKLVDKVNKTDIVDALNSQDATKVLSANQGYVLAGRIADKQDVLQYSTLPAASAALEGKLYQYVGETSQAYKNGYWYRCEEVTPATDPATYTWVERKYSTDVDAAIDPTSHNPVENMAIASALDDKQDKMQHDALPLASADTLGQIYEYLGPTSGGLVNGYFYKCVSDGETPATYSWIECNVQAPPPTATNNSLGLVTDGDGTSIGANGEVNVVNRLEEIDELPTAAAALEGKKYLLADEQTGYTKGGIYECQQVPESEPAEYEWVLISADPTTFNSDDFTLANNEVSSVTQNRHRHFTSAQWADFLANATSAEKQALDGASIDITDDNAGESELPPDEYSTTEVKTNKVWIDGKPIYRKCCVLTSTVSVTSASEWVNLLNKSTYGLENINVITQGYVIRNANKGPINALSLSPGSSSSYIQAHREGITWELNAGSVIVLEYTKTTD